MLCNCVSEYVTYTSHLLTTINGSVNVFIYFFKHKTWIRSSCLSCLLTKGSTNPNRLRVFQSEVVSTFISTRKSSSKEIDYWLLLGSFMSAWKAGFTLPTRCQSISFYSLSCLQIHPLYCSSIVLFPILSLVSSLVPNSPSIAPYMYYVRIEMKVFHIAVIGCWKQQQWKHSVKPNTGYKGIATMETWWLWSTFFTLKIRYTRMDTVELIYLLNSIQFI